MRTAIERIRNNPFYVLGLRPHATRTEIERQGTKLIGMIELKLKSVLSYSTPVGPGERTAEKVRQAMAELRDPERRIEHEIWARLDPDLAQKSDRELGPDADEEPHARADAPWDDALTALGWAAP